ncbi:tigger transposable element-derived protein 1-like [Palaemon carinicauda]|uniref:tigger transposable element-derived protein 1-like n=1 Tax=Palaemon carinicauda TaxID=392227 RepID=UPI0035B64B9D
MGPKNVADDQGKMKRMLYIETKLGIIKKYEAEDCAKEGISKQAPPEFKASRGWFEKVKRWSGIHSVVQHGEAASLDTKTAEAFFKTFNQLSIKEGYSPQQVFNHDKSGLFLEENASSDIHHCEREATQWPNLCFSPTVRKYLEENLLSLKCLLVLDNAHAHPGLEKDILLEYSFIKVLYLLPHTTPILQPMDQQAWQEVSRCTLNSAWEKLWPDADSAWDFEGFNIGLAGAEKEKVEDPEPVLRSKGLVVDEDNINELLEEHQEEFTTDDLKKLAAMQVNIVQVQFSSGDKEDSLTSAEIKEKRDILKRFTQVVF